MVKPLVTMSRPDLKDLVQKFKNSRKKQAPAKLKPIVQVGMIALMVCKTKNWPVVGTPQPQLFPVCNIPAAP